MKILFEKRWQRWLLAFGLAAAASILEIIFIDVKYQLMHVGMVLACAVLAISLLVKVELKSRWSIPVELLFTAFCGVFLLHIAINGQPLVLAGVPAEAGLSLDAQAVGVSGVLLALMLIFKPFGSLRNRPQQPTNSDRVIGKEAIVLTEIDPCEGTGTVKVLGQIWSAVSDDDGVIAAGERVTVCAITGVKLVVMKFTKGE